MSCQCYQIGGPFIAEDPNCEIHNAEGRRHREYVENLEQALRGLLENVVPHMQDIGHNAAAREASEAIEFAKRILES